MKQFEGKHSYFETLPITFFLTEVIFSQICFCCSVRELQVFLFFLFPL